jgi:hypothetical protein
LGLGLNQKKDFNLQESQLVIKPIGAFQKHKKKPISMDEPDEAFASTSMCT